MDGSNESPLYPEIVFILLGLAVLDGSEEMGFI